MNALKRLAYSTAWLKVLAVVLLWFGLSMRWTAVITTGVFSIWGGRIFRQGLQEQHFASLEEAQAIAAINVIVPVSIVRSTK